LFGLLVDSSKTTLITSNTQRARFSGSAARALSIKAITEFMIGASIARKLNLVWINFLYIDIEEASKTAGRPDFKGFQQKMISKFADPIK